MTGEFPQQPDPNERRQEMLSEMGNAISDEDYEFMIEMADGQEQLRPFEIVEYLDVKRRGADDPVEERRWKDGLYQYLEHISTQEFPDDEVEAIRAVHDRLTLEWMERNEDLAEEPGTYETSASEALEHDPDNWEDDIFHVDLPEEEIDRIEGLTVFQQAKAMATNYTQPLRRRSEAAKNLLMDSVEGVTHTRMSKVLDHYIQLNAEHCASDVTQPKNRRTANARELIVDLSTDDRAEQAMLYALDKHVFNSAQSIVNDITQSLQSRLANSKEIIESNASTPARRNAMFRRLGFM